MLLVGGGSDQPKTTAPLVAPPGLGRNPLLHGSRNGFLLVWLMISPSVPIGLLVAECGLVLVGARRFAA